RKIAHLSAGQSRQTRMRLFRGHEYFVGIPREIRKKRNRAVVLGDDSPAVLMFGRDDILKKDATGFAEMSPARARFGLDEFKDKIRRIDLTVRMRIRNANDFALVLKDQNVIDLATTSKIDVLLLPHLQ